MKMSFIAIAIAAAAIAYLYYRIEQREEPVLAQAANFNDDEEL